MILDSLSLWHRYAPRLAPVFAFLEKVSPEIPSGRHEIAGDDVFALVQRYQTRPVEGMQLEAHRRYIDVQYLVTGQEAIHWAPLGDLAQATQAYDPVKDVALYALSAGAMPVPLRAGHFMILFPDDAHAPCCWLDGPADVVKVVVKVAVELSYAG